MTGNQGRLATSPVYYQYPSHSAPGEVRERLGPNMAATLAVQGVNLATGLPFS